MLEDKLLLLLHKYHGFMVVTHVIYVVLADEVLTPDSSRFWPAADYTPGKNQDSYDKQVYFNTVKWDTVGVLKSSPIEEVLSFIIIPGK